ncbi:MAG TPA: hypothetical protein ENI72_04200 [Rhodospirillales bacterium]|nr:hypothetical protein [Rhodospirillales bacterium]
MADTAIEEPTQTPDDEENPQSEILDENPEDSDAELSLEDLEVKEARAAMEAEEAELTKEPAPEGEGNPEGQETEEKAEEAEPEAKSAEGEATTEQVTPPETEGQPSVMIPKSRFDSAQAKTRGERDEALQSAAYWKGRAEQAALMPQGTPATTEPEITPDQIIAEAREQKNKLVKEYDDGTIDTMEYETAKDQLEDRIFEARQSKLTPPAPPQKEEPAEKVETGEDLYLDQLTAGLEEKHPFALAIPADDPRWGFLEGEALRQFNAEGTQLQQGARGLFMLRERMAQLTDQYGPLWTGKTVEQLNANTGDVAARPTQETTVPGGEKPGLSSQAKARKEKLILSGQHPPDISNLGSSGINEEITDADIEKMTDEEIAALPDSAKQKFL